MAVRQLVGKVLRRLSRRVTWLAGIDAEVAVNRTQLAQAHEQLAILTSQINAAQAQTQALGSSQGLALGSLDSLGAALAEERARGAVRERQIDVLADSLRRLSLLQSPPDAPQGARQAALPRISVIMPVYNRVALAVRAVSSVLAQQGASFELIVVDDGSTEDLKAALGDILDHPALKLSLGPHGGQGRARNRGLELATGDVVAYLDADNLMLPGYLRALAGAYAAHPAARCAYAALLWDDGRAGVHLRHDEFDWDGLLAMRVNLDTNCFSHRRELIAELGGWDESLPIHADFDLVLRYTRANPPLRVHAIAAHYDHRADGARISMSRPSLPSVLTVRNRYRKVSGAPLRVLIYCHDYPQLSESYVDAEVSWLTRQGVEVEIFSREVAGAAGRAAVAVHTTDLAGVVARFAPDVIHCHWLVLPEEMQKLATSEGIALTIRAHAFEYSPAIAAALAETEGVRSIYVFPHLVAAIGGSARHRIHPVPVAFDSTRKIPRPGRDRRLVLRTAACLATKDLEMFFNVAALRPEYRFVLVLARIKSRPELPAYFEAFNASLGNPVDIRWDVQQPDVDDLMTSAGVYLHTFGFQQPFGMPMSIAESMACGSVLIARDHAAVRTYAGPDALYYTTAADASALLEDMLGWDDEAWLSRARRSIDFAWSNYADEMVLPCILNDWRQIVARDCEGNTR